MPIAYPEILAQTQELRLAWSERDAILYALAVGMGADPMDRDELAFVYEKGLKALPTLAAAVSFTSEPVARSGVDFARVVHADQHAVFHRPFPASGALVCEVGVARAIDRGEKGAALVVESRLRDLDGEPLATLASVILARGDGGFGGPAEDLPQPHRVPERAPDLTLEFPTRPEQALLYRLTGDLNPLHADPEVAARAGFPRPILHGFCTYGICGRAVLKAFAGYDPARMRTLDARFSAPVFPGETLAVDLWRDGEVVSFEARVRERETVVVRSGRSLLRTL